jgi:predicted RNA-binding protein with PIN domain
MIYLLDGYNIIGLPKSTENECIKLILMIKHAKKLRKHAVIIFFDGGNFLNNKISLPNNIKLYYSGERTADEAIIDYVRRGKKREEMIVVTKDRDLQKAVKYYGGNTIDNEEFIEYISREKNKPIYKDESLSKRLPANAHKITEELRKLWLDEDE